MAPPPTLPANEVHVWYVRVEALAGSGLLARYRDLLTPEELEKNARFHFEKDRNEHLVARALARTSLSRYVPSVPPHAWRFRQNEHGCPFVDGPPEGAALRFNLTHSHGLVACAVALGRDVGVDVEAHDRNSDTVAVADRFFAKAEVAELFSQPPERQTTRFFHYWTLKEAYIKARAMGLALPLDQFAFAIDPPPIRIQFGPKLADDDPASWQFLLTEMPPRHFLSVAVRRGGGPDTVIQVRQTTPLLP